MFYQFIMNSLSMPLNPSQRIFWPFLISSTLVALLLGYKERWRELLHPSSLMDFKIMGLNLVLKAFVFPLILFSSFSVSVGALRVIRRWVDITPAADASPWVQSLTATLIAFILNDFLRFLHHYLMHRTPLLRLLHRTHHSALVLTPFTLFRAHPLESLIAGARNIISLGLTFALYSFLFGKVINIYDFLGVNIFGFLFNATLSNLRHSPIPISFGLLEYIFISPRMHQIHHSSDPRHWNKNYGVALSLWDQLVGSFYRPTQREAQSLSFGLHQEQTSETYKEATTWTGTLVPQLKNKKDEIYEDLSSYSLQ